MKTTLLPATRVAPKLAPAEGKLWLAGSRQWAANGQPFAQQRPQRQCSVSNAPTTQTQAVYMRAQLHLQPPCSASRPAVLCCWRGRPIARSPAAASGTQQGLQRHVLVAAGRLQRALRRVAREAHLRDARDLVSKGVGVCIHLGPAVKHGTGGGAVTHNRCVLTVDVRYGKLALSKEACCSLSHGPTALLARCKLLQRMHEARRMHCQTGCRRGGSHAASGAHHSLAVFWYSAFSLMYCLATTASWGSSGWGQASSACSQRTSRKDYHTCTRAMVLPNLFVQKHTQTSANASAGPMPTPVNWGLWWQGWQHPK